MLQLLRGHHRYPTTSFVTVPNPPGTRPGFTVQGINLVDRFPDGEVRFVSFVMSADPVPGMRKPYATIGMYDDVVSGVKRLAPKLFRKDGNAAVLLVVRDPTGSVLAGELAVLAGLS